MQWLFAFIGLILAAIANENLFAWSIAGFCVGHLLNMRPRIKKLELQLLEIQRDLSQLNHRQTAETSTDKKTIESPAETITTDALAQQPHHEQSTYNQHRQETEHKPTLAKPDPWLAKSNTESARKNTSETRQKKVDYTAPDIKQIKTPAINKLFHYIWLWFTDGNTFVRVGIVILFVGVSFLLSFAIDQGFIPIEMRLTVIAGFALFLISIGWKLRHKRTGFALLIQGGAVGLLYLTIFASFNLYQVLPASLAFGFLIIIVTLTSTLAILQNALSLVLFAVIGGFLAPILTSTGSNNFIGLFSFYALLNAGIFAIAWFKAWKVLNLVGFTFTFSISSFWGISRYQPENFTSIEPFLILFFLFYVAIAILYASRRAPDFKDYIDGTLIFGTPIIAFGMQAAIVNRFEYGVAISAIVMGLFYLLLAVWCWKKMGEHLRFLSETLLSVAVIFATLAIPFAVDGSMTSATWAVEATGILWVSIRQEQHFRRIFALLLQLCAGFALLSEGTEFHPTAFLNSAFIGVLILSFCAGISSWMLQHPFTDRRNYEATLSPWLLAYSLIWLFGGYQYQIDSHPYLSVYHGNLILLLTLLSNAALNWLAKRFSWPTASLAGVCMLLPILFVIYIMLAGSQHPSEQFGPVLWPLTMIIYFFNLKNIQTIREEYKLILHLIITFLIYFLLLWEGLWQTLLGASILSPLFYYLYKQFQWTQMRACALILLPVMLVITISSLLSATAHPFVLADKMMGISWSFEAGYVLWPLAFFVLYTIFYRCDMETHTVKNLPLAHILALLLLVTLPTWEASWHLSNYLSLTNGWHIAIFPMTTIVALGLIMQAKIWPFKQHQASYYRACPLLIFYLLVWTINCFFLAAKTTPLPWIPLVNPAELMQTLVFITLLRFIFVAPESYLNKQEKTAAYTVIASLVFIWLNVVLLRTIHYQGGLAWSASLMQAPVTQTSLSIFWTISGLGLAVLATRKQIRHLWITGATLLVIVVFKLFLFDMSSHDSIERIISFIGVGLLLMMIGYFAPLPPANRETEHVK